MAWSEDDAEAFIAAITPRQHVEGVSSSCVALECLLAGRNACDLASDEMLRAAVEMKFIHIGAALEQLEQKAPQAAQLVRHRALFVALYHGLTEHYDEDHRSTVWQYWQTLTPDVQADAEAVLRDMPEDPETQQ